jgi:thioredoxin reductase
MNIDPISKERACSGQQHMSLKRPLCHPAGSQASAGLSFAPNCAVFDVIVIGGGPAGLSAALMLGRCRRRVLVCDDAKPRNARSVAVHGYLTRDGTAPDRLNAIGRAELRQYDVECRPVDVAAVNRRADGFAVSLGDGRTEEARYLLIATGVVDDLPAISGFDACYGRTAFHCPYCDGWEWRDRRLAVCGGDRSAVALALGLRTWSADVVLCGNGSPIAPGLQGRLARNGVAVRTETVLELDHRDGMLAAVRFDRGEALPRDAIFFRSTPRQRSDLPKRLGCTMTRRGLVKTGTFSDTNVPGVFVAGDASRDAQFVVVAAGEGVKAAVAINEALQKGETLP